MDAMPAYYNELDPYAAQWLRNLIAAGHIAPGDVDERSIVDVRPDDLRPYDQCHFFAGIGGWSYALRLAGWPDDRPVWTGSCPCQPFSAAGGGKAADDERHLWPDWFRLIRDARPPVIFGEQVEAAIGWGWLDAVFADLEAEGYACGASVLPACGVGAPHIRQRLWFVADARGERRQQVAGSAPRDETEDGRAGRNGGEPDGNHIVAGDGEDGMADAAIAGRRAQPQRSAREDGRAAPEPGRLRDAGELGDASGAGFQERERDGRVQRDTLEPSEGQAAVSGSDAGELGVAQGKQMGRAGQPWEDCVWLPCTDGKTRPVEPGTFPLAHGIPGRVGRLRAYGNAIVPPLAAEFITAACAAMT
jgi:DNA (cytosine-5)-methyltransferase 1